MFDLLFNILRADILVFSMPKLGFPSQILNFDLEVVHSDRFLFYFLI